MSIPVVWDNLDKTALRLDFPETWTWEQFRLSCRHMSQLLGGVRWNYDVILNAQSTALLGLPINAVQRALRSVSVLHNRIIVVTGDDFSQVLVDHFMETALPDGDESRLRFVRTLEEARRWAAHSVAVR